MIETLAGAICSISERWMRISSRWTVRKRLGHQMYNVGTDDGRTYIGIVSDELAEFLALDMIGG